MAINLFLGSDRAANIQDHSTEHYAKVQELKERLITLSKSAFKGTEVVERVFNLLDGGDFDAPWRYHSLMKDLIALALKSPDFMEAQGGYKDEAPADLFRMLYFFERLAECDFYHKDLYAYVLDQFPASADVEMIERDIDQLEREEIARTVDIKALLLKAGATPSSAQEQLNELRKEMELMRAENARLKKRDGKLVNKEELAMAS